MDMDIKVFQAKLVALCDLAARNNKLLTAGQVQAIFQKMELNQEQYELIYKYLKSQGIQIEGMDQMEETPAPVQKAKPEENPCLTEHDKEYLKTYLDSLQESTIGDPMMQKLMPVAAQMAAEMYRDGMNLADLIQEANLGLLTILAEDPADKDESAIMQMLRNEVKKAVDSQDEQIFGDDTLVAKVQKLDNVMKELTEGDEGEPKFSVEELAVMLDMDIDEMQDILRLTGDV